MNTLSIPKPTRTPKKKKGLNKVRKTPVAALHRKLKALVSRITRLREKHCVTCEFKRGIINTEDLQNGHLLTSVNMATRYDITEDGNCHTQCGGCNMSHEHHPEVYTLWYIKTFGLSKYEALVRRHKTQLILSRTQLEDMVHSLEETLEVMK